MPRKEKQWQDLLASKITEEDRQIVESASKDGKRYDVLYLSNVINGGWLHINCITCYLNYTGGGDKRKTNTFIALTLNEFVTEKRKWLKQHWTKLKGVAIVECIDNTHFHSVYLVPMKHNLPIIGYDSKSIYDKDRRSDLFGDDWNKIKDGSTWDWNKITEGSTWTPELKKREQQSVSRLVSLISSVAEIAVELNRGCMSEAYFNERGIKRPWKILRSFVSQKDYTSCGVLTCLFLESMRGGYNISGVKKDIHSAELEEYRWTIGKKLFQYRNEDYTTKRGKREKVVDVID